VRHRHQAKAPATDRLFLNHRATSRLYTRSLPVCIERFGRSRALPLRRNQSLGELVIITLRIIGTEMDAA